MSTSTDRVMQTVTRYFEVASLDAGKAREAEDAARRASADPEFRDALTRVLEADWTRGSLSACTCTHAMDGDSGIDSLAWLPDSTREACALQVKLTDAAGSDPWVRSHLAWLVVAAIRVDRSSLGATDAWSLRSQPAAGDIAAVRKAWQRIRTAGESPPAPPAAGDRQEPDGGASDGGYSAAGPQRRDRAPADLRKRASRLIETRDEAAALKAAEEYLREADRVLAEAERQLSQARRLAAQAARDRERIARDRAKADRDHRDLDLARELLAARERELKAIECQFPAQKEPMRPQPEIPAPAFPASDPPSLRPDPRAARTPAELLEFLVRFRVWSGNPSLRRIAERSGYRISAYGVRNILSGDDLPGRLEVIDAIVKGCGGSQDDRAAFAYAWRRLRMDATPR